MDFLHRMIIRFFFLYSLDPNSIKTFFLPTRKIPWFFRFDEIGIVPILLYLFCMNSNRIPLFNFLLILVIDSWKRSHFSIWNNWNKKIEKKKISSSRRFVKFILFGNESVFMLFRTVQILCLWNHFLSKGNEKNYRMDWYLCLDRE